MKRTRINTNQMAEQVKASARSRPEERRDKTLLIPTGSTLLNLALSDSIQGGWGVGKVANLIGDSSSGKTLLALTMFAEMNRREDFKGYRFIYDDVERALEFDLATLLGKETVERIEPPSLDEGKEPRYSDTIQDFQCFIDDALEVGKPFVYVLDSFDALTSRQEQEKVGKMMEAHRRDTQTPGTYGMDNPKIASQILRMIKGKVKNTGSFVLIISQTRDNIDPMSFEKKTRSGGRALKFYSCHEVWLAMAGKIKRRDRAIGNGVKFKVTKNKFTGKLREGAFSIYYDYGLDDITSCIDFLVSEGYWKEEGRGFVAPEFDFKGQASALVKKVEEEEREGRLQEIVGKGWREIEDTLKSRRKGRYD